MYIAYIYIWMYMYVHMYIILQGMINAHHEYASDLDRRHKACLKHTAVVLS